MSPQSIKLPSGTPLIVEIVELESLVAAIDLAPSAGLMNLEILANGDAVVILSAVGAETFTGFPNLPLELRLKIWEHSHEEGVLVAIQRKPYKLDVHDDAVKAFVIENKTRLPVALHVNQESRFHALKKHSIILPGNIPVAIKFNGQRPICAKASDIFYLEFSTIMNGAGDLYDWLSALKTSHPGFIGKITKLEVRDTCTEKWLNSYLDLNKKICMDDPDPLRNTIFGPLLLFPNLKKITFTGKNGDAGRDAKAGLLLLAQLGAWIVAFLKEKRLEYVGGVAPTVIVLPSTKFQEVINE